MYSISGVRGGQILIWVTNPSSAPINLSLQLNASYFGLEPPWTALNLNGFGFYEGDNSDISMNIELLPESYKFQLYLVSITSSPFIVYSSGDIVSQLLCLAEELFSISSLNNQSIILAVPFNSSIQKILLNDPDLIPELDSNQSVVSSGEGWYYDNQTHLLVIGFVSTGSDRDPQFCKAARAVLNSFFPRHWSFMFWLHLLQARS